MADKENGEMDRGNGEKDNGEEVPIHILIRNLAIRIEEDPNSPRPPYPFSDPSDDSSDEEYPSTFEVVRDPVTGLHHLAKFPHPFK